MRKHGTVTILKLRKSMIPKYEAYREAVKQGIAKIGDYVPELDDPGIGQVAKAYVYLEDSEKFLDKAKDLHEANKAADTRVKLLSELKFALRALAASRRDRLKHKSEKQFADELYRAMDQVIYGQKKAGK